MNIHLPNLYYATFGVSAASLIASICVISSILFYQHNIETLILTQYVFWITVCDLFSALFFCCQLWPVWTYNTPDAVLELYDQDSHSYYGSPALRDDWGDWLKMFYFIEMFCTVASWLWWFFITVKVCNIMLRSKISFGSIVWEYGTILAISTVSVLMTWNGIETETVQVSTDSGERDWVVLRCIDETKCSQSGYIMVILLLLGSLMITYVLCRKRPDAYIPRRMLIFVSTYIFIWIPMIIVFFGTLKVDPHIIVISLAAPGLINALIWTFTFSQPACCCHSRYRLSKFVNGDLDSPLATDSNSHEKIYAFRVVLNDEAESEFLQELESRRQLWDQVTEFLDHTPVNSLRSRPSLSWGSDLGVGHKYFNTT